MGRWLTTLIILSIISKASSSVAETQLIRHLFSKSTYDKRARPVAHSSDPLNVTISLALYQLVAVEEKDQQIEVSAWLTTEWDDHQMEWNPSEYEGIKNINVRSNEIWVPDIVLYNNVDDSNAEYGGNMDTLKTRVIVSHNGNIYWSTPIIIKASCKIRVREFPYDIQKCTLTFGSWTFDETAMNLSTKGLNTGPFLNNSAWNLEYSNTDITYDSFPSGRFAKVNFYLHFQRRSLFYAANMVFPMSLITMLTIVVFILPSDSGERIGMGVTLMLTATVFMLLVAETTPESSEGLPILSVYVIFCMVLMFLIIVLLCYISRLYNRGRTDRPMPQWIRQWILNRLSYAIGARHHHVQRDKTDTKSQTSSNEGFANDEVILTNMYGTIENENAGSILRRMSRSSSMNSGDVKRLEFAIQRLEEASRRKGVGKIHDHSEAEELSFEGEWRVVALTLDRVLFVVFSIVFIVGTIAFYAPQNYVR